MENFSIFDFLGADNPFTQDPQEIILENILTSELKNKNQQKLEIILKENYEDLTKNKNILKLSIKASVLLKNLNLAYELSKNLSNTSAKAIIEYTTNHFDKAAYTFNDSKNLQPNMKILHSLSYYYFEKETTNNHNINVHSQILDSITKNSDKANSILGAIHFNKKEFDHAEKYFGKAKELKKNEINYLNFFKTLYRNKKTNQLYNLMNDFFINTNSSLNYAQVERNIRKEKIEPEKVVISNLYKIISKIL